ncbi:MAG TPA: hypothetical protein VK137_19430 [Planctomycetaceae bacterium]|nr:hypothetical protein [Planctomycetaceae bacterium]
MTFQSKLMVVAAITVVIAQVLLAGAQSRRAAGETFVPRWSSVARWLATVACALVVVGIVSHTLPTHLVQITPLAVASVVCWRRLPWSMSAAAPLFVFWLLVMLGIWLFLLGIAPVFTGTFSTVEIILTVVIAIASVFGMVTVNRQSTRIPVAQSFLTVVVATALQGAALVLSYEPFIVRLR